MSDEDTKPTVSFTPMSSFPDAPVGPAGGDFVPGEGGASPSASPIVPASPATLQLAALAVAVSQLGVHEQGGNNRGPEVDQYLAAVGLDPGFSWCAAFVFWCFRQAAQQLGLVNPCPRTAGAVRLWTLTEPICRDQAPAPGAIYVLDHGGHKGHAGIIKSIAEDGTITEISGNTNAAGSREGNAVARHVGAPAKVHGGVLLGFLLLDRAAQAPSALVT